MKVVPRKPHSLNVDYNERRKEINMKLFEAPEMTLVHLASEEIITASGECSTNYCYNYDCDCDCTGYQGCFVVECSSYHCTAQICPTYA